MNRDYDYASAMKEGILVAVGDMIQFNEINRTFDNKDALIEYLCDKLWDRDSVTGNGSGSYWLNRYKAEEAICHNLELYEEAISEYGGTPSLEPEVIDVEIRCYLLHQVLHEMADEKCFDNLIEKETWKDPQ